MVIDIHTHTFPDKIAAGAIGALSRGAHIIPHTDGTIGELLGSMDDADIDVSVVVPVATSPAQVVKVNDSSIRNNEKYFDSNEGTDVRRVLSFGCIHPEFSDYRAELRRIAEHGIKGIKLHPVYQKCNIDDVKFLRIIDCAAENGIIVITHAGIDIGFPGVVHCSPQMCRNVWDEIEGSGHRLVLPGTDSLAERKPEYGFKFILAHMGGWTNWDEVPYHLADTGVYLDTSFSSESIEPLDDGYWDDKDTRMMDADQYMEIIRAFGPERILFGSDSPWTDQKRSREFIEKLPLSGDELRLILGGNAERILDILTPLKVL
ncbi:MAG: amidohydrolase family protein [Butyrivibrio sp.]|nr:amidohydrolase family protein [Butyrivibrio sp.]